MSEWIKPKEYRHIHLKYRKTVLSNNQCAMFGVYSDLPEERDVARTLDYYVIFGIADKFKILKSWMLGCGNGNLDVVATGKCGLEGLIWARENIKECIEDIRKWNDNEYNWAKRRLIIGATTPERFKIYKRALIPLGFKEHRYFGESILIYE